MDSSRRCKANNGAICDSVIKIPGKGCSPDISIQDVPIPFNEQKHEKFFIPRTMDNR
jgi:hypothetical protein